MLMSNIDFAYIAGMCCLGCTLYCFKDAFKLLFGGNYVIGVLFYFVASITYFLIHRVNSAQTILELISLGLAFSLLPLLFFGISKKCFLWIKLAIAVLFLLLTAWAIVSNHSLFVLSIPMLVGFFLFYAVDGLPIDNKEENEAPEEDLLYRTGEYDRLFKEIRQLAGAQGDSEGIKGINLALCSPWGSGKSHFLTHMRAALSKAVEKSSGWEGRFEVWSIDLWKMQRVDELWAAVNSAIMRAVMGEEKAYIYAAESTLLRTILQIPSDAESAKNIYKLVYNRKDDYSLSGVNEKLKDKRVLLVFEDLERADSKILVSLLPLLDRIRKIRNVITICALDNDELQRKLEREGVNFESYMTKVFDRRLFLSSVSKSGIIKMQEVMLANRYHNSVLLSSLFSRYPHRFETPRKLIRTFDALENLEHLYFNYLSEINEFSFKEVMFIDRLFMLFMICEVEIIRACAPDFLKQIVLNDGMQSFLSMLPKDEMRELLFNGESGERSSLADIPVHMRLYKSIDDKTKKIYTKIKDVAIDNGCVLNALAYLHAYRDRNDFEVYFMGAYLKQYVNDDSFFENLKRGFYMRRYGCEEIDENEPALYGASLSRSAVLKKINEVINGVADEGSFPGWLFSLENDNEFVDSLKIYNRNYPYEKEVSTNISSLSFVKNLVDCFSGAYRHDTLEERLLDYLFELYKTMHISEQAHVLSPAFYLMNKGQAKGQLDEQFKELLSSERYNHFIRVLCELYAEHLYIYAVSATRREEDGIGNEYTRDFHLQAYKNASSLAFYRSFIRGVVRASQDYHADLSVSLISFTRFIGMQYKSSNYIDDVKSSFATREVAAMMKAIYKTIKKKYSRKILAPIHREQLGECCESVRNTLLKDVNAWDSVTSNPDARIKHIEGIGALLELVEQIRSDYLTIS